MNIREKESQRVAEALRNTGLKVNSVFDLVNSRSSYKEAIPVLIELLPTISENWIKEGIVRALAVKEAAGEDVSLVMTREFEAISPSAPPSEQALKWAIANTLSVVARDSVFEKIAALARDKQHGKAREMLAVALGNMKDPRANDALSTVDRTLRNPTDVVGPFSTARGRNTVVDVFSRETGFTVRVRADGAFETLIQEATPRVRPR